MALVMMTVFCALAALTGMWMFLTAQRDGASVAGAAVMVFAFGLDTGVILRAVVPS